MAAGLLVGGPVAGSAPAAAAVSCVKETTPPTITAFSFSPTAVDVRRGAKTVTVTGAARDSGGVASMTAYFTSPRRPDGKTSYASATMKLSKGTAANGTFTGRASVGRWVIPGSWTVQGVIATDRVGNSTYLSYADLKAKGWRRDLKVTSVADVTAPTLTSFTMSPVRVDTRKAAKRIKVTAKARDTQSGVLAIGVTLTRAKGAKKTVTGGLVRSKGTVTNGTFTGYVTVPRWVGTAGWQASVSVFDAAFNSRSYSYAQLGAKRWTRTASVTSGTDASLPVVTAEKFTPTTVDVRSAAKTVTATATAKDTGSGVARVAVTWTSPSKRQSVTASLARKSGTALSGGWSGKATVPVCSEPGTWTASVTVTDVAGNTRSYPAAKLGRGWTRDLKVIGADTVAPTVAAPREDVPAAGPVRLTFSEPVKGVSTTSLAVRDLSDRPVAGRLDCRTAAGATVSCASGPVSVAVFTPSAPFTDYGYTVTMNPTAAGAARLTDLAGNPGEGRWPAAYFYID